MSYFSDEDIKKLKKDPNSHVVDINDLNDEEDDAVNIGDIDHIQHQVIELLEFLNTDEAVKLSRNEQEAQIAAKFPYLSQNYYTLVKLILNGGDLDVLFQMLETLRQVKSNKLDMKTAEVNFGKVLANKFIPKELKK